mmetsp:Transcript_63357/g.100766  ORF Transcript_63357/g.100766 Transcript_63357/m.100766 type:complete len:298 (-) Transcript_63357:528-1421(-)
MMRVIIRPRAAALIIVVDHPLHRLDVVQADRLPLIHAQLVLPPSSIVLVAKLPLDHFIGTVAQRDDLQLELLHRELPELVVALDIGHGEVRVLSSGRLLVVLLEKLELLHKRFDLVLGEKLAENLEAREVDLAVFARQNVAVQRRQHLLVNLEQLLQASRADVDCGQMRNEVVAHKHRDEHEVVDDRFKVKLKRQLLHNRAELDVQVLAQYADVQQLEFVLFGQAAPSALVDALLFVQRKNDLLAQQRKVHFVRHQREDDEVGVEPVDTVSSVGVVVRLHLCVPNVLHDFVLSLAGH